MRGTLRLKVAGRLSFFLETYRFFMLLECCYQGHVEATPGMG